MDTAAIQKRLEMLETALNEYKTKKEMIDDALKNDSELTDLEEKAKEAKRRQTLHKEALLNEPEYKKSMEDLKDLALEVKETRQLLGDELVAYFMENKVLEFVDSKGIKRKFRVSAKFVGSKNEE